MKTKSYVRFLNRSARFDADIELADVLKISVGKLKHSGQYVFHGVNPRQHPRLAQQVSNPTNRSIALNHLKATLSASFLKDIYEDVTAYMQDILAAAAQNGLDPNRLIGEHKVTLTANEVLQAGNWSNVVRKVTDSVIRSLENEKNTKKLLMKINSKLNLDVDQTKIDAALPYLELRHLLVHSDGKADAKFCRAYPSICNTEGKKIKLDHALLQSARTAIHDLVAEFDRKVVDNNIVATSELQN